MHPYIGITHDFQICNEGAINSLNYHQKPTTKNLNKRLGQRVLISFIAGLAGGQS